MVRVVKHVSNPAFKKIGTKKKKQESAVVETLAPKVIQIYADGRPLTQHETMVTKKQVEVETIPWITWAEKHTQRNGRDMANMMVMLAMGMLHDHATTPIPIACVRRGGVIQALTTRTMEVSELVVPLFFKKQSSTATAGEGVTVHPKAVCAVVSWAVPLSESARDAGMEGGASQRIESVHVQPELKLPSKGEKGFDWTV